MDVWQNLIHKHINKSIKLKFQWNHTPFSHNHRSGKRRCSKGNYYRFFSIFPSHDDGRKGITEQIQNKLPGRDSGN